MLKQILIELWGKIDKSTITVREPNALPMTDGTTRLKFSKDIVDLNNSINQFDQIYI